MKSSTLRCWQLNQHIVQDPAPLCGGALSSAGFNTAFSPEWGNERSGNMFNFEEKSLFLC